jgi:galactokinase
MQQYFAPGRINLIGEHLDYNGGSVLPVAISLGITANVTQRNDQIIQLSSEGMEKSYSFSLNEIPHYKEEDDWANYPKGVFAHLLPHFSPPNGFHIHFKSNLPIGSGLSSSAAIEVLTAYILRDICGQEIDRKALALECQSVENKYIGVNCGIMDQFAVANGEQNKAIFLDCVGLNYKMIPFETGEYKLLVLDTCKPRALRESKYNERREECERAFEILYPIVYGVIEHLPEVSQGDALAFLREANLRKRAIHVISENERVYKAKKALVEKDILTFGQLMNESHASLQQDYEVTGKELDAIVAAAQTAEGCIGARMTGAGFGGCAIALVHFAQIEPFKERVKKLYLQKIGYECEIYAVEVVDGVGKC